MPPIENLAVEHVSLGLGSLCLADVDVALTESGGILIDEHLRTSNPAIYAAGDVTGRHQFVYMAAYGAKLAALNALNGDAHRYDATAMPMVTFTDPQVASVGLTEAAARAEGIDVKASVLPLDQLPRAPGIVGRVAPQPSSRRADAGTHLRQVRRGRGARPRPSRTGVLRLSSLRSA